MKTKVFSLLTIAFLSGNLVFAANAKVATFDDYNVLYNQTGVDGLNFRTTQNVALDEIRGLIESLGLRLSDDAVIRQYPHEIFYNDIQYLCKTGAQNNWIRYFVNRGADGAHFIPSRYATKRMKEISKSPLYHKCIDGRDVYLMFYNPPYLGGEVQSVYVYIEDEFTANVREAAKNSEKGLAYLDSLRKSNLDEFNNKMIHLTENYGGGLLVDILVALKKRSEEYGYYENQYYDLCKVVKKFVKRRVELGDRRVIRRIQQLLWENQYTQHAVSNFVDANNDLSKYFKIWKEKRINGRYPMSLRKLAYRVLAEDGHDSTVINDLYERACIDDSDALEILLRCAEQGYAKDTVKNLIENKKCDRVEGLKAIVDSGDEGAAKDLCHMAMRYGENSNAFKALQMSAILEADRRYHDQRMWAVEMIACMVINGADYALETLIECYLRGSECASKWVKHFAKSSGVSLDEYINSSIRKIYLAKVAKLNKPVVENFEDLADININLHDDLDSKYIKDQLKAIGELNKIMM